MGSADDLSTLMKPESPRQQEIKEEYGANVKLLPTNDQVKELQTILRDRYGSKNFITLSICGNEEIWFLIFVLCFSNTTRSDFKFYADRLVTYFILVSPIN